MCFTPAVSLTTALLEWAVALFILRHRTFTNKWFAVLLGVLGLYQFTEFLLCVSDNLLWAQVGFISYTLLPIIGLYYGLSINGFKVHFAWYIPAIISILFALRDDFIVSVSCGIVGVGIQNLMYGGDLMITAGLYLGYYFGYIALTILLLMNHYRKQSSKILKMLDLNIIAAILLSMVPAVLLFFILPALRTRISSIYCGFSVIFALAALIAVHLQKKQRRDER